jgi:hypothetical protein
MVFDTTGVLMINEEMKEKTPARLRPIEGEAREI